MRLMATNCPVSWFKAFMTVPKLPSPSFEPSLYFYIWILYPSTLTNQRRPFNQHLKLKSIKSSNTTLFVSILILFLSNFLALALYIQSWHPFHQLCLLNLDVLITLTPPQHTFQFSNEKLLTCLNQIGYNSSLELAHSHSQVFFLPQDFVPAIFIHVDLNLFWPTVLVDFKENSGVSWQT